MLFDMETEFDMCGTHMLKIHGMLIDALEALL